MIRSVNICKKGTWSINFALTPFIAQEVLVIVIMFLAPMAVYLQSI